MEQVHISSPQAPQGSVQASRGKSAPVDGQEAAGAGDFLSLLSALGGEVLQDLAPTAMGSSDGAVLSAQDSLALGAPEPPATDMASLLALQSGLAGATLPDTSAVALAPSRGGGPQVVALGTMAAGAGAGAVALGAVSVQSAWSASTLGMGSLRGAGGGGELGMVAQTAALDAAAEESPASAGGGAFALGARRAGARVSGAAGHTGETVASTTSLKMAASDRQLLATGAAASALASVSAPVNVERRESAGAGVSTGQPQGDMALAAFSPAVQGTGEWLRSGSGLARGGEGAVPSGGTGGQSAATVPVADSAEVGASSDPSAALGPEDAVTEQVAYWVSQNIQNAELTVEHAGHPVEVSVALTGKEAHVTFRSDQGQTRELLDASVDQLRELLGREGLELSGVTVGSSGGQGSQSDEAGAQREGQRGARQAAVQVPGTAGSGQRPAVLTDKAVDIFV